MTELPPLLLRRLGRRDYLATWRAMQEFTDRRGDGDGDELWLAEHPPLFTQGLNGRAEHLHDPGPIPVVAVDRGGQATYHGPGQLLLYPLLDLRRHRLGVRELVHRLEEATIAMLAGYGIAAAARPDAPGVYVAGRKIASLGLRVRRGCCYHGLALNVSLDLAPFRRIDPCGLAGIEMTRTADLGGPQTLEEAAAALLPPLAERLGYRLVEGEGWGEGDSSGPWP